MNLSPYPEHTKKTRCNNNLNLHSDRNDFFRPIISNTSVPITNNHEHYICDKSAIQMYQYDIERSSISTRNDFIDVKKPPVQQSFQNDYYMTSFDNMNHSNEQEINKYLNRNPVNTRRDNLEKSRNTDRQDFLKSQGGVLNNYSDFKCENTRKNKTEINSSNYIPMPRTMAIPKDII